LNRVARFVLDNKEKLGINPPDYVIAFGPSLGGIDAIEASFAEDSPIKYLIIQAIPDTFEDGFRRGFSELSYGLADSHQEKVNSYFCQLLGANLAKLHGITVDEANVLPRPVDMVGLIRKPCLFLREEDDSYCPQPVYKTTLLPALEGNRDFITVCQLQGGHDQGQDKDRQHWQEAIRVFLDKNSIPYNKPKHKSSSGGQDFIRKIARATCGISPELLKALAESKEATAQLKAKREKELSKRDARAEEEARLKRLVPAIKERIKTYGIAWLTENGGYSWDKDGLALDAPVEKAGIDWSECGAASELIGDMLCRTGINGFIVPINFASREAQEQLLQDHVVVLTDNGFVIDSTGWSHAFGEEGLIYTPLEDYPFRQAIGISLQNGKARRIEMLDPEASHIGTCFHYLFSDLEQKIGIVLLPLSFQVLDRRRIINSCLGIGFYKAQDGQLNVVFGYSINHSVYHSEESIYDSHQSISLIVRFPLQLFFGVYQRAIKEIYESRRPEEMQAFIEGYLAQGGGRLAFNHNSAALGGLPDMREELLAKAKDELRFLFAFMSCLPCIADRELAQLIEDSPERVLVTAPFPQGSSAVAGAKAASIQDGISSNHGKTGEIVVLRNDQEPKYMVSLPVIKVSDLDQPLKASAACSLERWMRVVKPEVEHKMLAMSLFDSLTGRLSIPLPDYYLVFSEDCSEVEGWFLNIPEMGVIEIAPWNRRGYPGEIKYKGLGSELRAFAIHRLQQELGETLYTGRHIAAVETLGRREPPYPAEFSPGTINRGMVEAYLAAQGRRRSGYMAKYGMRQAALPGEPIPTVANRTETVSVVIGTVGHEPSFLTLALPFLSFLCDGNLAQSYSPALIHGPPGDLATTTDLGMLAMGGYDSLICAIVLAAIGIMALWKMLGKRIKSFLRIFAAVVTLFILTGCVSNGPLRIEMDSVSAPKQLMAAMEEKQKPVVESKAKGVVFGFEGLIVDYMEEYLVYLTKNYLPNMNFYMAKGERAKSLEERLEIARQAHREHKLIVVISFSNSDSILGIGGRNSFIEKLEREGIPVLQIIFDDTWDSRGIIHSNVIGVVNIRGRTPFFSGKRKDGRYLENPATWVVNIYLNIEHVRLLLTPERAESNPAELEAIESYTRAIINAINLVYRNMEEERGNSTLSLDVMALRGFSVIPFGEEEAVKSDHPELINAPMHNSLRSLFGIAAGLLTSFGIALAASDIPGSARTGKRPSKEQLEADYKRLGSQVAMSRLYGVHQTIVSQWMSEENIRVERKKGTARKFISHPTPGDQQAVDKILGGTDEKTPLSPEQERAIFEQIDSGNPVAYNKFLALNKHITEEVLAALKGKGDFTIPEVEMQILANRFLRRAVDCFYHLPGRSFTDYARDLITRKLRKYVKKAAAVLTPNELAENTLCTAGPLNNVTEGLIKIFDIRDIRLLCCLYSLLNFDGAFATFLEERMDAAKISARDKMIMLQRIAEGKNLEESGKAVTGEGKKALTKEATRRLQDRVLLKLSAGGILDT
ncbi:MAG: hypothetical protein PHT41_07800, partial [Candidatus Omnitrophica bacterium]|nr:hypothetical protein [Candidatus Omnitrophota bacterium]